MKSKSVLKNMLLFCSILLGIANILAEEGDFDIGDVKESDEKYNTIIVSANRSGLERNKLTTPLVVIDKQYLNENMFTSMADMLDSTQGISSRYDYHSPIYVRGFSGNNIIIMQDGCRRISNTPSGTRANRLSAFNIERVEIIKGPGSVMYGSGGLSGIVNVITVDPFKEEGLRVRTSTSYSTNNEEKDASFLANYNGGNYALQVGGRYREADAITFPDGSEARRNYLEDTDFTAKLGFKPTDNQKIIVSSDIHLGGPWSKAQGFNGKPYLQAYFDQEDSYHFMLLYEAKKLGALDLLQVRAFYDNEINKYGKKWYSESDNETVTSDTKTTMKDQYGGGSILFEKNIATHRISTGVDGNIFRVWIDESEYSTILAPEPVTIESESIQGGGSHSAGCFLKDTIDLSPLTLQLGLRFDLAEVIEGDHHATSLDDIDEYEDSKIRSAVSGNVGFVLSFFEDLYWNFNVGRAFRMPNYDEMYSERLTGKGVVSGNPGIEPEYSLNFDTGLRGTIGDYAFEADTFINFYDDLIKSTLIDEEDSDSGYIYKNLDRTRIYGYELVSSYEFVDLVAKNSVLKPRASFTHYFGDDLGDKSYLSLSNSENLSYIPNPEVAASLRYTKFVKNMLAFGELSYTYALEQSRVGEGENTYPSYYYINAKLGFECRKVLVFRNLRFNIAVNNLTNNEYHRIDDYLPARGRDFKFYFGTKF